MKPFDKWQSPSRSRSGEHAKINLYAQTIDTAFSYKSPGQIELSMQNERQKAFNAMHLGYSACSTVDEKAHPRKVKLIHELQK